mmetsp:Transcript_14846/g.35083  ORF Transcript_14846/g.35083 Transcript_14846/m.35083 type:complete len:286 (+) Transcript_14846:3044-3901(+)
MTLAILPVASVNRFGIPSFLVQLRLLETVVQGARSVVDVVLPLAHIGLAIRPSLEPGTLAHVHAIQLWMIHDSALVEADPLLRRVHATVFDHLLPHLQELRKHCHLNVLESVDGLPVWLQRLLQNPPLRRHLEFRKHLEADCQPVFAASSTGFGCIDPNLLDELQGQLELRQARLRVLRLITSHGYELMQADAATHLRIQLGEEQLPFSGGVQGFSASQTLHGIELEKQNLRSLNKLLFLDFEAFAQIGPQLLFVPVFRMSPHELHELLDLFRHVFRQLVIPLLH